MVATRTMARRLGLVSLAVLLVAVTGVAWPYRDQIWAYATHLKGSPTHSHPWSPYPPDEAPPVRLAVAGDIGDSGQRQTATADAMIEAGDGDPYDAVLLLGDNVYPAGDPAGLDETILLPFRPILDAGTRLLAILGNHDVKLGHGDDQMRALGMRGRWWATTVGDVTLIGLDSTQAENPEQRAFLERKLAAARTTWKIVALHHPPYSAGYQSSNLENREAFEPLFVRYGVQLVLSGHEHDYQRSIPIDGVTYVVSGAASGTRRTGEDTFTAASWSWNHFLDVSVFEDRLEVRPLNHDLRQFDEVTIPAHPVTER